MKRNRVLLLFALLSILLSGCGMRTVDEMYSIPKRSPEYKNLQAAIDSAMTDMEYAAPVAGDNRQSVQTADLDGDGVDEYIVFAKVESDNPLRILVFRQPSDEKFELLECLTCKGAAFEQVQYVDFDGRPGRELVVGRSINDQINRVASVYSFADDQANQILSTIYNKYITCDLDENGLAEMMVVRNGEGEHANGVAMLYSWEEGVLERSLEAPLSEKADQIRRITVNALTDGEPAVYVASTHSDSSVITDVYALRNHDFTNIALLNAEGTGVRTLRNYFVFGEDLDSDGILELPALIPMRYAKPDAENARHLVRWYTLGLDGSITDKLYTFHNFTGGWYMELRSAWQNRMTVEQDGPAYTFYIWNESYGEAMAVFTVFTFTGKDRDSQADVRNRFALYRGDSVVYAAKLESASAIYGISEEYLMNSFHLIRQDWKNGES